ncbi:MAG: hypothetical protein IVW52_04005 [Acidimicrobiales bacterium]|nr:hypothetical protein [Acidimicrobiales bacterium]
MLVGSVLVGSVLVGGVLVAGVLVGGCWSGGSPLIGTTDGSAATHAASGRR